MSEEYLTRVILRFIALLPALTLHEFAHAYSAWRLGDPTPRMDGRVTLNPLAHLDPLGTLMILFAPIGWAKPVRVNPMNFRDPSRGMLITSAAGPLSNIAQGIVWGLLVRALWAFNPGGIMAGSFIIDLLLMVTLINFILAFFNLIPLGPLDGHSILMHFLPYEAKQKYVALNQYGMAILMGLILLSVFGYIRVLDWVIFRPAMFLTMLVSGAVIT